LYHINNITSWDQSYEWPSGRVLNSPTPILAYNAPRPSLPVSQASYDRRFVLTFHVRLVVAPANLSLYFFCFWDCTNVENGHVSLFTKAHEQVTCQLATPTKCNHFWTRIK